MKTLFTLASALLVLLLVHPTVAEAQSGITIITHGLQGTPTLPTWVNEMAEAIEEKVGASIPTYRPFYNVATHTVAMPGSETIDITQSGNAILILDWAVASTNIISTQDIADGFFDFLFGTNHQGHNLAELPIHLIGHSRGASLNSRLAYRLAQKGILVEQMTTVDPHPVVFLNDWNVTSYQNTVFADNYYRLGAFPAGQAVPGSHNNNLSAAVTGTTCIPHTETHTYYHGTIDLAAEDDGDCLIIDQWYTLTTARNSTGFRFSRLEEGQALRNASGIHQGLTGGGGTGVREAVSSPDQRWPNVGLGPVPSIPEDVTIGLPVPVPYYYSDLASTQRITFFLDADTNPFNGVLGDIGSVDKSSQAAATIGAATFLWTPTLLDVGMRFVGVRTTNALTDVARVRYDYVLTAVNVLGTTTAPSAVSVTPSSGSGAGQTFSYLFSDPDGFADISWTLLLVNGSPSAVNGCSLFFLRSADAIWLLNDAGTVWQGPVTLGSNTTLQNSQCSVNAAGSSASGVGTDLTVNIALLFKSAFAGQKTHFILATDNANQTSNWQTGTYDVTGSPPTVTSVTPASGSGPSQTFSYVFADPNGFTDIAWAAVLINDAPSAVDSCLVFFDRGSSGLLLLNDSASAWLGPTVVGSSGTLQNSQCAINSDASSVSGAGANLTLNLAVSFNPADPGVKFNIAITTDVTSQSSDWQLKGTWTP